MGTEWDTGRVPIQDPEGLGRYLRAEIKKRELFDPMDKSNFVGLDRGAQTELLERVSKEIGMSRSHLYKLLRGQLIGTSWHMVAGMAEWLGDGEAGEERLLGYMIPESVRTKRRGYLDFIDREIERFQRDRTIEDGYTFSQEERSEMDALEAYMRTRGLPFKRFRLARFRIVDPLVAWPGLRQRIDPEAALSVFKDGIRREKRLLREEATIMNATTQET